MIFMELRCEDSSEPYAEGGYVNVNGHFEMQRCWSHENSGCGTFTNGTQAGAISGAKEMFAVARKQGWKRMKHGWVCPHCVSKRVELENNS